MFQSHQRANTIEQDIKKEFGKFIQHFADERYLEIIKSWFKVQKASSVLTIKTQDLMNFNNQLAFTIFEQYYKYQKLLNQVLTRFATQIEKQSPDYRSDSNSKDDSTQKYFIAFQDGISGQNSSEIGIRDLKSSKIGRLESLFGTVTRTTQVRPQLLVGVFRCRMCNKLSKPIEQQFKYTQPKKCLNDNCDSRLWELDSRKSQFADFQQLRVQQDPNSIPPGGMPRSISIILRNYNAQKAQPGDMCKFVGYLCVVPQIVSMLKPGQRTALSTRNVETRGTGMMQMQGVKGIKGIRQLNYKFMFIANNVIVKNKQYNDVQLHHEDEEDNENDEENQIREPYSSDRIYERLFKSYGPLEMKELSQLRDNSRLYDDLADSLFPGIHGHPQIKKALLLQLFGGVHKCTTKNKMKIRGDINILIVGDPSTAKSQFLKTVNKFVPRSIYTNGKTTSAAGLTASVVRDDQGNVGIQAGALMLADNGVCCIDQFDKMNLSDMTAIHEAMEQQTISIAKAGVHATLNARTSILAAANPLFGRYDKTKNLQKNINISPPIMSRFDLFFVICDESNVNTDSNLCEFIIKMHRQKDNAIIKKYNTKTLRFYISVAKKIKPRINAQAAQRLRQCYVKLREGSKTFAGVSYIATVRQLQSMIRLSEALARLHLDLQVNVDYVDEAYRLISNSITKLEKADVVMQEQQPVLRQNKVQNVIEQQVRQKNEQRKEKKISISAQVYEDITTNILKLFKQTQKVQRSQNQNAMDQQKIKLTQGNVINYIVSLQFEKNLLNTEDEQKNFRKIVRAVIKRMIRAERWLMISQDNDDENERGLQLHPNYDFM